MTDNLQGQNDKIINNIKSLQTSEMKLYNSLENQSLQADQKQQIIEKINQISDMKINLYQTLKDNYSNYQQDVSSSRNFINEQMIAIDVIENELNDSKRRLHLLEAQKINKIRLVEINTYYGKQYNSHKKIMKIIFIMCIPILILTILGNKGIIPSKLSGLLTGVIIIIGAFIIGAKIIELSNKDNMNYDEYDWYFDKENATTDTSETTTTSGPWDTPTYTCVGAECCNENNIYDSTQNMCILDTGYNTTSTTDNTDTTDTTDTSEEAFVSGVLSKYAYVANNPTTRLHRNVRAYNY
jgi:hypothetical protein